MFSSSIKLSFYIATCVTLPILIGGYLGFVEYGILGCLGAMTLAYLPHLRLPDRIKRVSVCGFGFIFCFSVGALTSFNPFLSAISLGVITICITYIAKVNKLAPPGTFFFIVVYALASTFQFDIQEIPTRIAAVSLGVLIAIIFVFIISHLDRNNSKPAPVPDYSPATIRAIAIEATIIGFFVGASYLLALISGLDNPYWVPISCVAVLQGQSFSVVMSRQFHRVIGTFLGLSLAWGIFYVDLGVLWIVFVVFVLQFLIDYYVPRHYGLAVIFITPLTVLFADSAIESDATVFDLLVARFVDILLGSLAGLLAAWVTFRTRVPTFIMKLLETLKI